MPETSTRGRAGGATFDRNWIGATLARHAEAIRQLGELAAKRFGPNGRTQISNLERVALQAMTFDEIEMYIKRQAGQAKPEDKGPKGGWVAAENGPRFADEAIKLLEALRQEAESVCQDPQVLVAERVPERLAGAAFRHVNSEYLFWAETRGKT